MDFQKKGYWWECTECGFSKKDPTIVKVIQQLRFESWNQELLNQSCPQNNCHGILKIAFYRDLKEKDTALVQHIVGISFDDKIREPTDSPFGKLQTVIDFLPMMWEWNLKDSGEESSYFDLKHMSLHNPNVQTLTNIVSLSEKELSRLISIYREKTGKSFLNNI